MQSENGGSSLIPPRWGIEKLSQYQAQTWDLLSKGQSGLLVLPTGGGKRLLDQLWSYHQPGLVVVLSPLIALIEDQVKRARALGLKAQGLHSGLERDQKQTVLQLLKQGGLQLIFVTPERFKNIYFIDAVSSQSVSLLVVDEAHLISQWGHDFRPDYRKIDQVIHLVKPAQVLALTATAIPEVADDIRTHLKIDHGFYVSAPVARTNLSLHVQDVHGLESKAQYLVSQINQVTGPVLIYSSLIKTLYQLEKHLRKCDLKRPYWMYHGDLSPSDRYKNQNQFLHSPNGIMLATPAFGLGIDKKDIRLIIHLELPGSIESYFQEVGRAGRDGASAKAILFYDEDDILIQMEFIKWSNPDLSYRIHVLKFLFQNRERLNGFELEELKRQLHFYNLRDYRLETTLSFLESIGYLKRASHTNLGYIWNEEHTTFDETYVRDNYLDLTRNQQRKLFQLVQYLKNKEQCRMQLISQYFQEPLGGRCGTCDNCLG